MKIKNILIGTAIMAFSFGFADSATHASETTGAVLNESQAVQYLDANPGVQIADPAFEDATSVVVVGSDAIPLGGSDLGAVSLQNVPAAGCPLRRAGFTSAYTWTESTNGCGIIGASWDANYRYSWSKDRYFLNVASDSCVQGRGYYYSLGISEPRWQNAGCGANGQVVATIGNRATVAKVRGKTMTTTPSAVYWR